MMALVPLHSILSHLRGVQEKDHSGSFHIPLSQEQYKKQAMFIITLNHWV